MPAYEVSHPDFAKPRAVECSHPKRARAHVAKEFKVRRLGSRDVFELGQRGVDLVDITPGKGG